MAKNRGLVNRVAISSSIKNELYEWLKAYSDETGIPITKLLDKSIESFKKTANK